MNFEFIHEKRVVGTFLLSVTLILAAGFVSSCAHQNVGVANSFDGEAKNLAVRANMKNTQAAAEAYFKDHTYMYPKEIDDEFKSYFPGGDVASKKPGNAFINPFTGQVEWPVLGSVTSVQAARSGPTKPLNKGVIEYSPIDGGKSYAIRGGGWDDKEITVAGSKMPMVLSRKDEKSSVPALLKTE